MLKLNDDNVLEAIVCNDCGREFTKGGFDNIVIDNNIEFHTIELEGGYHSRIGDGDKLTFHLCDVCMINLIAGLSVAPDYENTHCYTYVYPEDTDERSQEEINDGYHDRIRQISMFSEKRESA